MSSVLNRSLIFVTLMVLGLVVYTQWFNIKAERFEKTALLYIEKTLPVVTGWQFEQFRPLLSPAARSWFESDKGRELYRLFSHKIVDDLSYDAQ